MTTETVAPAATTALPMRERSTTCSRCATETWAPNALCNQHGSDFESLGARLGRAREGYAVEITFAELADPAVAARLLSGELITAPTDRRAVFVLVAA